MKRNIRFLALLMIAGFFPLPVISGLIPTSTLTPDAPSTVTMATLLPSIMANVGYTTVGGTDVNMPTAIWIQQLAGIDRQAAAYDNYDFKAGDCNNLWNSNYSSTMMDIKQFIDLANAKNSPTTEESVKC
jgi:hypothetical protein